MEDLPPEILHLICANLQESGVLSFRLVSRTFAAIRAKHLLDEVAFYLHDSDFTRLKNIAQHDVFRHNVTTLIWNCDQLDGSITPYDLWLERAKNSDRMDARYKKTPIITRTRAEWMRIYDRYVHTVARQEEMIEKREDFELLNLAICRFPALKSVAINCGGTIRRRHFSLYYPFNGLYSHDFRYGEHPGVRQFLAVVVALAGAKTKLKTLRLAGVHWNVCLHREMLDIVANTQSHLTTLQLDLVGYLEPDDEVEEEIQNSHRVCRRTLKRTKVLSHFLRRLPRLHSLELAWSCIYMHEIRHSEFPAEFEDLIEEGYVWKHLRNLTLRGVVAKERLLLQFFELHNKTLRFLEMDTIDLTAGDSWMRMLPQIQKTLKLRAAWIEGRLFAPTRVREREQWMIWGSADPDETLGDELEAYLCNGGELPLTRENMDFKSYI